VSAPPRDLLQRIEARVAHLTELRAEAEELQAELLAADRELAELESEMRRVRQEMVAGPTPERWDELRRSAEALRAAADQAEVVLRERGWDVRIELHEIETGIATDDALRLREEARRLADELGRGPDMERGPA
jgi:hypothetical protein